MIPLLANCLSAVIAFFMLGSRKWGYPRRLKWSPYVSGFGLVVQTFWIWWAATECSAVWFSSIPWTVMYGVDFWDSLKRRRRARRLAALNGKQIERTK